MRIAHIVGKMVGGGVESVVMNYYRHIDRSRYQFDFIVEENSPNVPYKEIDRLGGKVYEVPPVTDLFRYNAELKSVLTENNYEVVHSHLNALSVFPLRIAKKCGVRCRIAHSHSTTSRAEFLRNIVKLLLRPFSRVYANTFVACSCHAGNWLFGKRRQFQIIHNAIDINRFLLNEKSRTKIRDNLGIADRFVVGHVGRFVKQKNHEFLVECFQRVKDIEPEACLLLVGEGPLVSKIEALIMEYGLQDSVLFVGQKDSVGDYYSAMDVFCLPSFYEGLGMVAIEAQISGLPVIASDAVPDEAVCVKELVAFLSLEKHIDTWSKRIVESQLIRRVGREKSVFNSDYNIETSVYRLMALYDNIVQGE